MASRFNRIHNWHTHLNAYINDKRDLPFAWGTHDCILFAMGAVNAITGTNLVEDVIGSYSTVEGAYKTIRKHFKRDQLKSVMQDYFDEPKHIAYCRQGDVVFRNANFMGFDCIAGICNGQYSFFVTEENGLIHLPTLDCDGAFTV